VIHLMLAINCVVAPLIGPADLAGSKVDRHGKPSFRAFKRPASPLVSLPG
jgi:hypothetical protein